MTETSPLVVAVLPSDADDKMYQIRCDAYGLEMQIDDEWQVEFVLLAPYAFLGAVTRETGITREAIASAGVTDVPETDGGGFNFAEIVDAKNNWLLLGHPSVSDSDEVINAKLRAALAAGCRVILCAADPINEQLESRLQGVQSTQLDQIVVAYMSKNASQELRNVAAVVRASIEVQLGTATGMRVIVGGHVTEDNARRTIDQNGLDGILLLDSQYKDFCPILDILTSVCQ